jgi:hypothetical protein
VDEVKTEEALVGRPKLEVSDIFRHFRPYLKPLGKTEAKAVCDILNCRTSVLGGHRLKCDKCEHEEFAYNSCRNRHCPKCQFLAQVKWVEARKLELLPVGYFHVVFTVPHELNPIIWANKKIAYDILFRAMSETLKEVSERRLKARIGFTAVLHTWSQTLNEHAHIHAIVPGGGIALNGEKWISAPERYLLPCKVLSKVFRGKYLDYLEKSFGKLKFTDDVSDLGSPSTFKSLLVKAARQDWVIYAKRPFAGPEQVLEYLGNYTHRIAISNYRIEKITRTHVTFRYKDRADNNRSKITTVTGQEFCRRFLAHVLPTKFVRIRHLGFLGSRQKSKNIEMARRLLGVPTTIETIKHEDFKQLLLRVAGHDIDQCPCCPHGKLKTIETLLPWLVRRQPKRDTS